MTEHIGKYVVQSVLGAGAFGQVVQAFDPDLQKSVAIKKLKVQTDQQTDTRLLFTREARDTSKLVHPNIVTVHGLGIDETDGVPYLVMELLEGITLERMILQRSQMPLVQKIEIMHQVAEGLQFAHTRGVIHRDIKPANIMVLPDGTAKVMDFAVAPEGFQVGTPAYMAPELRVGPSDVLTDVFAFGAVYFELLTGAKAFQPGPDGGPPLPVQTLPSVSARIADCPPWLELLIGKLIATRRDERLESLEEMLVETRPTLQKLKSQHAAQLASRIAPLMNLGDREGANQMISQVLRLDPLNREARAWRSTGQDRQREQARAMALDLVRRAEQQIERGAYQEAQSALEHALELDSGNQTTEKLLESTRRKAQDVRASQLLLDEVLDDIIAAGPKGMPPWQVENVFQKLTRAVRLDERNGQAALLRTEILPGYERVRSGLAAATASAGAAVGGQNPWYEQRLTEARKARRNREFDYAEQILCNLLEAVPGGRAQQELSAVREDREAFRAGQDALSRARSLESGGKIEEALRDLNDFAERYPRWAKVVQEERRSLEAKLELPGGAG